MGETFQRAGLAINQRIKDDAGALDYKEIKALSHQAQELLIKSKTLFELATIEIGMAAQDSLMELNTAQHDIVKTLKTIKTVQTAIDLSAKLVSLSGAVLSGNAPGIVSSVKEILRDLTNA